MKCNNLHNTIVNLQSSIVNLQSSIALRAAGVGALLLFLLTSCLSDPACYQKQKITASLSLDSMAVWSEEQSLIVLTDQWDTVSVTGIPGDSVLYDRAKKIHTLHLSLRPDTNITTFRIDWHQQSDTIFIRHLNDYQYISFACGCFIYYVIDSVWSSHHFIDHFYITDSDVQDQETDNLHLSIQQR